MRLTYPAMLMTAFVTCGSVAAYAQTPTPVAPAAPPTEAEIAVLPAITPADEAFIQTLAIGGMSEVDTGNLAVKRASNAEVKHFAKTMVVDHSKSSENLKVLAKERKVALPKQVDAEHAAAKTTLEQQAGAAFDAQYMDAQVKNHQKTVQLLQQEIDQGSDSKVRHFAQDTLPMVQHHLQMAKQLQTKVSNAAPLQKTSSTTVGSSSK